MSHTINENRARFGLPPLTKREIEDARNHPPQIGSAVKPAPAQKSAWNHDMAQAPRDRRILVQADPTGEIYVAHWVMHPGTGHEAWCIAWGFDDEGTQVLCQAKAWAEIPGGRP